MSPILPSIVLPDTFHHALHDLTVINFVEPAFKPLLRLQIRSSKKDAVKLQHDALVTAKRLAHISKRLPVCLNLIPDSKLVGEEIHELTDEALCAKYRVIRLSVASSLTGTLINVTLIPFFPTHVVGATLNSWQSTVALINRHNAKKELERRKLSSKESAELISILLDGDRGRAKDVCVGIFVKGALVAATMGFTDLMILPANADSLATGSASHASTLLAGLGSHFSPCTPGLDSVSIQPTGATAAHEALKAKAEAISQQHPFASHAPLDTAGYATDQLHAHLVAENMQHFGIADAPSGTSSLADLARMHAEGLSTGTLVAEVANLGAVAEGANLPALVGDVVVERAYERHIEKEVEAMVEEVERMSEVEGEKEMMKAVGDNWQIMRAARGKPVPSPVPSTVYSYTFRRRRSGEDQVFRFKD